VRKRRLRWREITQMIRLDALRRVLRRMKSRHRIILLDEDRCLESAGSISHLPNAARRRRAVAAPRRQALVAFARLRDFPRRQRQAAGRSDPHARQAPSHGARQRRRIRRFTDGFRKAFERVIDEMKTTGISPSIRYAPMPPTPEYARLRASLARRRNGH